MDSKRVKRHNEFYDNIKDQFEAWLDDVVGGSPIIWEIEFCQ